jgi:hypothetical protein
MTDKPISAKTPRAVRKGAPPTPAETLGALTAPVASDPTPAPESPDAAPGKAKPAKPVAAKRAKQAASLPIPVEKTKKPVSERTKPLNFRVTNEFRKGFKQAAATEDCKKVELLERMFEAWLAAKAPAAH